MDAYRGTRNAGPHDMVFPPADSHCRCPNGSDVASSGVRNSQIRTKGRVGLGLRFTSRSNTVSCGGCRTCIRSCFHSLTVTSRGGFFCLTIFWLPQNRSIFLIPNKLLLVPGEGVEPSRIAPYDFESYASANSATRPKYARATCK